MMRAAAIFIVLVGSGTVSAAQFGAFKLEPWGPNGVRVRVSPPGKTTITEPIQPALLPAAPAGTTGVAVEGLCATTGQATPSSVTHGNLKATIDSKTGYTTFTRVSDGAVLLKQTGLVWGTPTKGQASRPDSVTVQVAFQGLEDGESVYGLGEHKNRRVEQGRGNGYKKVFADSLYYGKSQGGDVSIPWYMSSKGYGFVWNLPSFGSVDLSTETKAWLSNATLGVDFWVSTTSAAAASASPSDANAAVDAADVAASEDAVATSASASTGVSTSTTKPSAGQRSPYAELLNNYADVVGHASPMPFWTTGFIQCKDRYRNQTQLMDVARGYVERGLPISMIVIDWFHWKNMGDWKLNPECWPDPQAMVDELRELGIELMITCWPFMGMPYPNGTATSIHWDEFNSKGYLANSTATGKPENFWEYATPTGNAVVDSSNPAAMASVTDHWYEGYGKYGVKAVWMDESEPDHASYISGGQWDLHAGTDTEILPAWVKYWSKGFSDKFKEVGHGDDYFILSRNGWAGTQAYGTALWSGDIGSNFNELQTAVQAGQQTGVSGIPLWTTDIGGYSGGNPDTPGFQELIVRWFQFGAFCPLFRLHGHRGGSSAVPANQCGPTNGDNEVWNLAKDPEHYDAITTMMHLREDLRDYVKRLNNESVHTGMPMMRPMFLEFPNDVVTKNNSAEAQFMFGSDWLVSPVTTSNATSWPVYLPTLDSADKSEWVYWWDQTVYKAGKWYTMNTTSIAEFPLFVKRPVGGTVGIVPRHHTSVVDATVAV